MVGDRPRAGPLCPRPWSGDDRAGRDVKALAKTVIKTALDEEMADHLGYHRHDPGGRGSGNSRNGVGTKTVLTDNVGPVQIDVPRTGRPPSTRSS